MHLLEMEKKKQQQQLKKKKEKKKNVCGSVGSPILF